MTDLEQKRREVRQRLIDENQFPKIPENWGVERLRFLFTESKERNGKSPVGEMLSVSEYRGVVPREYESEERKRTDDELENYRVVRPGQLAVNSMWLNHLGLGVSDHTGHVSPAYNVYDVSNRLDCRFVHHLMRSNYYLKIYLRYLYGIRPNSCQIKSNDWASIPIIVPDLSTQRQIANFLDVETARVDELIEGKLRLMRLLAEKREGRISEALSKGNLDIKLKHVAMVINGYAFRSDLFEDEGVPVVRQSNLKSGNVVHDGRCYPEELVPTKFFLEEGDLCIGMSGSIENFGVIRDSDLPAALNQRVAALRARPGVCHQPFLGLYVQSRQFKDYISRNLPSTTIVNIDSHLVSNAPVPAFQVDEQVQIVDGLSREIGDLDQLKDKISVSIDRLNEFRATLITAAVTGQIDVESFQRKGKTDRTLNEIEEQFGT